MIQIISFVQEGKIVFQALTGYGSTNVYPTERAAQLAGLGLIREAQ